MTLIVNSYSKAWTLIKQGQISLVADLTQNVDDTHYLLRRTAVDFSVPLFTHLPQLYLYVQALERNAAKTAICCPSCRVMTAVDVQKENLGLRVNKVDDLLFCFSSCV